MVTAQERFSFFQASTPESVERMLTLANLQDNDVVVDLGSGDGLIPLTAARLNQRLRGRGVDIDPALVEQSNARAAREGLADRVTFVHQNAFDARLSDATVVTMWLFPELMRLLRPVILERARPGTRVLTSTWNLGNWPPDATDEDGTPVYLWIVPARIGGAWQWDLTVNRRRYRFDALFDQQFQNVEGAVRVGHRREIFESFTLRGAAIASVVNMSLDGLGLTRIELTGSATGDRVTGTATVTPLDQPAVTLPWQARRSRTAGYFERTGTDFFVPPPPAVP